MGHRHRFGTSQMFETNQDQHCNCIHPEVPFVHFASSSVVENNSLLHPGNNLQTDGVWCVSHWNPSTGVNEISSSRQIVHPPQNQSDASSTRDSFHSYIPVDTFQVPDNHVHHTPLSNYVVDNSDVTVCTNVRGQHKRKSPMVPSINETGSTSGYYCGGSSSNTTYERQNADVQNSQWEHIAIPPSYNPPIGGESFLRNVRSRSSLELNPDFVRPHRVTNYLHHPSSSWHLNGPCNPADHSSWRPTLPLLERNDVQMSTASHGSTIVADSGNLNQDMTHLMVGSSIANVSRQIGGYSHDPSSNRNPASLQRFNPTFAQTRAHSSYHQRPNPTNRVGTMGSFQLGQAAASEGRLQFSAAESYSNRHPRAFTSAGWRNSDRSRSRLSANRHRSFLVDHVSHDHMTPEGVTGIGRSSFNTPRGLFDQHRELRLDVDNMSYEELLALGERIGSVDTGLSDDQQLKCLKESVYLSTEQVLTEERCAICLEEYQNMDRIGSLESCSHGYHVECIKKWLSMKNLCPICKVPALPDGMKKEKMKASIP